MYNLSSSQRNLGHVTNRIQPRIQQNLLLAKQHSLPPAIRLILHGSQTLLQRIPSEPQRDRKKALHQRSPDDPKLQVKIQYKPR